MAAMSSVRSPGRRRHSRLIAAGLAACGLLGVWTPAGWAAQVTGSAAGWTRQTPSASPSARFVAAAASDPAARDVVLFGGQAGNRVLGDTWTWSGSTWTRRHPAVSPPARARRRSPTTGRPARSCCSADSSLPGEGSTTPGPGTNPVDQASSGDQSIDPGRLGDHLRRGGPPGRAVRRSQLQQPGTSRHMDVERVHLDQAASQSQPGPPGPRHR